MNNKGFTLIDILGVIAIIAIIGLITVPLITNVLRTNQETLTKAQQDLIIRAAKSYVNENPFTAPKEGRNRCIDISTLKSKGYLDDVPIKNPETDEEYNGSVQLTKNNNQYTYTIQESPCPYQ